MLNSPIIKHMQMKAYPEHSRSGFTIVELVIVIVVIAILAAIVLLSYRGVTASANDSAVISDLKAFAEQMALNNLTGANFGDSYTTGEKLESLNWKASKSSYDTSVYGNLHFCHNLSPNPLNADWGTAPGTRKNWALIALSKSGNIFYVTDSQEKPTQYSNSPPMDFSGPGSGLSSPCAVAINTLGEAGYANVYGGWRIDDTTTGPWRAWAGGN